MRWPASAVRGHWSGLVDTPKRAARATAIRGRDQVACLHAPLAARAWRPASPCCPRLGPARVRRARGAGRSTAVGAHRGEEVGVRPPGRRVCHGRRREHATGRGSWWTRWWPAGRHRLGRRVRARRAARARRGAGGRRRLIRIRAGSIWSFPVLCHAGCRGERLRALPRWRK